MSLSMDEFRKQLQEAVLAAQEKVKRAGPQPWHGFWYHRPDQDFPPRSAHHTGQSDFIFKQNVNSL